MNISQHSKNKRALALVARESHPPTLDPSHPAMLESRARPERGDGDDSIGKAEPHCACRLQCCTQRRTTPPPRPDLPYPRLRIADKTFSIALANW